MANSYVVQPLFPSNSDPTVYAINFDPSVAALAQYRPLQRVPKGSILLQYESLNPATCVITAACAMWQKCSDTGCDTAVVVTAVQTGASGSGSNVTGLALAGSVITLTQGAGGNQTVDIAAIATNTTTHTAGAGVAVPVNTWTTIGAISNKMTSWWVANAAAETITHQVESRISGTNIQVRTNAATTVHLHMLAIN